jgi:tetratricopeptide (TPR) repeat protein
VLADVYNSADRPAEAESLFQEALPQAIALEGETGMYPLLIMNGLAVTYRRLDKIDEAESLYQRVIETRRGLGDAPDNQRELLTAMSNLAFLYVIAGRPEEAESLMAEFLSRAGDVLGPEHPIVLKTTFDRSKLLRQAGRLSEAEASLVPVLDSMTRRFGRDHPHTCFVMSELSNVHRDQGHLDDALRLRLETVEGLLRALGEKHESTQHSVSELVTLLETMNRPTEAANWRARLAAPES